MFSSLKSTINVGRVPLPRQYARIITSSRGSNVTLETRDSKFGFDVLFLDCATRNS